MQVKEIAIKFKVSEVTVYDWVKKGLKHNTENAIGKKEYIIIDPNDVYKFKGIIKPKKKEGE